MKSLLQLGVDRPSDRWWATAATSALLLLFLFLMVIMFRSTHKVRSFAFNRHQQVTVSIVTMPSPSKRQREKTDAKPQIAPVKNVPEESESVADIASLFSGVKTQKIKESKQTQKQKLVEQRRLSLLQSRLKTIDKKSSSNHSPSIAPLKLVTPAEQAGETADSGGEVVDKYYARIQALIYQNFFPPRNSEGALAIVRIVLTADGRLSDYMVLKHSGEVLFDREVDALKQRLQTVHFSQSPSGKQSVLDIRLISKE